MRSEIDLKVRNAKISLGKAQEAKNNFLTSEKVIKQAENTVANKAKEVNIANLELAKSRQESQHAFEVANEVHYNALSTAAQTIDALEEEIKCLITDYQNQLAKLAQSYEAKLTDMTLQRDRAILDLRIATSK